MSRFTQQGFLPGEKLLRQAKRSITAYCENSKASPGSSEPINPTFIGHLPVDQIDTALVVRCLEPIWATKTETANRLRGRVEAVLDWATVRRYRNGDNPARWHGHLDKLLPRPSQVTRVKHHAALPFTEVGQFMQQLREDFGVASRALEVLILTACRTNEVVKAEWSEFDLSRSTWVVPAARMKSKHRHRVPLSAAAIEVLETTRKLDKTYVFPGHKRNTHLSNAAMLQVLKRMERTDFSHPNTTGDWIRGVSQPMPPKSRHRHARKILQSHSESCIQVSAIHPIPAAQMLISGPWKTSALDPI